MSAMVWCCWLRCASRFADNEVGHAGRVRHVGHLIFKKKMPESFAQGRCLGYLMRNPMGKVSSRDFEDLCEVGKAFSVRFTPDFQG